MLSLPFVRELISLTFRPNKETGTVVYSSTKYKIRVHFNLRFVKCKAIKISSNVSQSISTLVVVGAVVELDLPIEGTGSQVFKFLTNKDL